ncbi:MULTISPECIES: hypothetical protein [unclassified Beijerinckia]|uniref:hypothetical protein n=1 Tax=unclassified Beijerinckia TaxID=2638183 RepID=UPI00089A82AE|nr:MULTISPECIES: hypothetical protein [unclassified Beijerinckia]MDH7797521.1 hypothetical protein [Beijerinckia sp. GAS462]SEC88978.1 hypothetical protein SAMN05443249_3815 [Beijerinckia sp. 28-YEA-48]
MKHNSHNSPSSHRSIPRGGNFESWLCARFPHVAPATARLLAERAGYVRDEWAVFVPVAVEVVAKVSKAMGAAHAG